MAKVNASIDWWPIIIFMIVLIILIRGFDPSELK